MTEENKQIQPKAPTPRKNDSWFNMINNIPLATHFYFMNKSLFGSFTQNLAPISQSGVVLNLLYTPFLDRDDLSLFEIDYDQKHYGTVKPDATSPTDYMQDVKVYKIGQYTGSKKQIGTFKRYPTDITTGRTTKKSWKNESKLYQYPYHFINICDYINTPLQIINHLLPSNITSDITLKVSQPLTVTGGYTLFIDGYKGDKNEGANEGMFSSAGLDLPTSSSQYAQFMATSKASFNASNEIARRNNFVDMAKGVGSGIGEIGKGIASASGAMASAGASAGLSLVAQTALGTADEAFGVDQFINGGLQIAGSLFSYANERRNILQTSQAKINDLMSAPRNVSLGSSDILMSLDRNNKKVVANRYHIREEYLNKLCDYFTLFGYKQNKLMDVEKECFTRKYFNYIHTIDANIHPKEDSMLEQDEITAIAEIFNNGITFWNYFDCWQDHISMYDYSKDNRER